MSDTPARKRRKQPYEKPVLRVIDLAAEEVLAVGCKTQRAGTKGFNNMKAVCIFPRQCYGPGS